MSFFSCAYLNIREKRGHSAEKPRGNACRITSCTQMKSFGDKEPTRSFPTAESRRELYDFLAPPQQQDEIGRLGPFRVLQVLGAGGMGVVFKAEDPRLKRLVALKAMLPRLAASETARKRFVREAKAAAAVDHVHVVPIFQVGEDRGIPFLAMQLLEGESLADRLRREPALTVVEMLRIGRETALGLAAAHQHGLIHRNVKPANLWLEAGNGERFRVKILDFGLARAAADNAHLTQSGAFVGTPSYMAPEQAGGEQIDHRADLFSLGCVLYRLATGSPPFKGKDAIATLVAIAAHNPKPPAEVAAQVPPELSDLVMQLLAKKPAERPETAQAVAETLAEIEETVTARSRWGPMRRLAWSKPGWLLAAAVVFLGLVAATVVVYHVQTDQGELVITTEWNNIEVVIASEDTATEVQRLEGHNKHVSMAAFSPDGDTLASVSEDGTVILWNWHTGQRRPTLRGHRDGILYVAYSPDGKTLATASRDRTVILWDAITGAKRATLNEHTGAVSAALFSADGNTLATASDDSMVMVREPTGKLVRKLKGHQRQAVALAYSADGKTLVSAGGDWGNTEKSGEVFAWDLETGERRWAAAGEFGGIWCVAYSPDGKTLAGAGIDGTVTLWQSSTGKALAVLKGHTDRVLWVAYTRSGRTLASASYDGTVRLWDAATGKEKAVLKGHTAGVQRLALSPDGRFLATAGNDRTVRIWQFGR